VNEVKAPRHDEIMKQALVQSARFFNISDKTASLGFLALYILNKKEIY